MQTIQSYLQAKPSMIKMVVGFLVENDSVTLGLRKQVSLGLGKNLIAGIGGKVGDSPELKLETSYDALKREFLEEVELKITKFKQVGQVTFLFPNKPKWNQVVAVYVITEWDGEPKETDVINPVRFNINELPFDQMWDDAKFWIPQTLDGKNISATILYGDDNKTVVENSIVI